jgi:hypothetical protein
MSDFGKVKSCINGCGALIYFDAQSTIGHPSPDKWIPLEFVDNVKTNQAHNCPKRSNGGTSTRQQQPQRNRNPFEPVSDESVNRGITAFTMMMTDLIKEVGGVNSEVKEIKQTLNNLGVKMNTLLAAIAKLQQQQPTKEQSK